MNAVEHQITAACSTLRGQNGSPHHRLEARPSPRSDRTPQPNPPREAKRFNAPADRPRSDLRPGRARPGIASVRGPSAETVAALGHSKWLWGGAFGLAALAMFRAAHTFGIVGGPVVVHLVWPV